MRRNASSASSIQCCENGSVTRSRMTVRSRSGKIGKSTPTVDFPIGHAACGSLLPTS